ncbi:MAG TPA: tetratricopeptide repeat protein [Anaerolineae bacterium]|nr:tetratricopeptide repeat protein [Anaerolineae bacterium]
MQCPACHTINPTQARFCMGCGLKLVEDTICGKCHTILPAAAQYCCYCGAFVGQPRALIATATDAASDSCETPPPMLSEMPRYPAAGDSPGPLASERSAAAETPSPPPPTPREVSILSDREDVLAMLQECGRTLLRRHGQIVSLIGASGLGKSRIKRELRAWLAAQGETASLWVEGRALAYGEQMNYMLLAQVVRNGLGLPSTADESAYRHALAQQGETLWREGAAEKVPFLVNLLGLNLTDTESWIKTLSPKIRQKQTLDAVCEFFTGLAHQTPLVIALDDLHWADETSLAALEGLLEAADRAPLLLLFIFRPRRDKGCWRLRNAAANTFPHRYTEITLKPLPLPGCRALLEGLLPGAGLDPQVQKTVLDKAAGNPFYIEEVVRVMVEQGIALPAPQADGEWILASDKVMHFEAPQTLHAAVVGRIERQPEGARRLLQGAAVLGCYFPTAILRQLLPDEAAFTEWLTRLERDKLLRPESALPGTDYAFMDPLLQEVAYNSLAVNARKVLHRRVGTILEAELGEQAPQHCDLLAYHFSRSDDDVRAIHYLEMAAQKARSEYANITAIQHYSDLLTIRERFEDRGGQAEALYQMGVIAYEIGDYPQAKPWLVRAVELYQEMGDRAQMSRGVMYVGMIDLKQANYDQALKQHARALSLAESQKDAFQMGVHLLHAARVLWRMGAYDRATQLFERALKNKRKNKDLVGQGNAYYFLGLLQLEQGNEEQAEEALKNALDLWQQARQEESVSIYAQYGLGRLALQRQQYEQAEAYFQQALSLSQRLALRAEMVEALSYLAQTCLGLGRLDEALDLSNRAITLLGTQKDVEETQRIYLNHYYVLAARDDPDAADFLKQAHDVMMSEAERLAEPQDRKIFLEQLRVNREIQTEMQQVKDSV